MSHSAIRRSPVHHLVAAMQPEWALVGEVEIAVRYRSVEAEQAALRTLGLCDVSGLSKLSVKGRDAQRWLADQHIPTPGTDYHASLLADGGFIIRLAADEFLLESGVANESVPALDEILKSTSGDVYPVVREDATFLITGSRALDVFAQTCGINFRETQQRCLVLTRMAGVSCGVFPDTIGDTPVYRMWVDPSYAVYLWETVLEICEDLGGSVLGACCLYPELS